MVKEQEKIGLSLEYIIHPGETLQEVLEDRDMTQRELAVRTGMTEKHISTVVHGQKGISMAFAKKLEYALGIEYRFWVNLQAKYEKELLDFEELNSITKEELDVTKKLKEVLECWRKLGLIDNLTDTVSEVLTLRKMLGISNLLDIPKISYVAAYRIQSGNNTIDPFVLFAWQRMCELLSEDTVMTAQTDLKQLEERLHEIKQIMFLDSNQIEDTLKKIFAQCGIVFMIVPNFKGAPVQGFIKRKDEKTIILCMTKRQNFADIFWFTLFHEIAHLLSGDYKTNFVDFEAVRSDIEKAADERAENYLLNLEDYRKFIENNQIISEYSINEFAKSQNVMPFIVQGRLMKDGLVSWNSRVRYEWE